MRRATTALDATNIKYPTTKQETSQILHGATTAATKSLALQTLHVQGVGSGV